MKNNMIKIVVASLLFTVADCQAGAMARAQVYGAQAVAYGLQAVRLAKPHRLKIAGLLLGGVVLKNYVNANRSKNNVEIAERHLHQTIAQMQKCLKNNAEQLQRVLAAGAAAAELDREDIDRAVGMDFSRFNIAAAHFEVARTERYHNYWARLTGSAMPLAPMDAKLEKLLKAFDFEEFALRQLDDAMRQLHRTMRLQRVKQNITGLATEEAKAAKTAEVAAEEARIKAEEIKKSIAWLDQVKKAFDAYAAS